MVVHHGTTRGGFTEFQHHANSRTQGFVFTSSIPLALTYSGQDNNAEPGPRSTKSGLYSVYLSVQNPKTIEWGRDYFSTAKNNTDAAVVQARQEGYDGLILRNVNDPGAHARMMQQRGHSPEGVDTVGDLYIAFEAGQIKSAKGNSGAFNRLDPDITDRRVAAANVARRWLDSLEFSPDVALTASSPQKRF